MEPSDIWAQECLTSTVLEHLESHLWQASRYRQEVADLIRLAYRQAAALAAVHTPLILTCARGAGFAANEDVVEPLRRQRPE